MKYLINQVKIKVSRIIPFILLSCLLIVGSCSKDTQSTLQLNKSPSLRSLPSVTIINAERQVVAKALSKAINTANFRTFLRNELSQQYSGDFTVLYARIVDETIGSQTVAQILANNSSKNIAYFADTVLNIDPLLSFYVHLDSSNISSWSTSYVPKVAAIPFDADEDNAFQLTSYLNGQSSSVFSSNQVPQETVILLKTNERIAAVDKNTLVLRGTTWDLSDLIDCLLQAMVFEEGQFKYIDWAAFIACINDIDDGGGGEEGNCGENCDRDTRNNKDYLKRFKFNSMSDLRYAEGWLGGRAEMRCVVGMLIGSSGDGQTITKYIFPRRRDIRHCSWFNCTPVWYYPPVSIEIINWKCDLYGDAMRYLWIEQDATDWSIEYTFGVSAKVKGIGASRNFKIKYSPKDDICGSSYVQYCDPANLPIQINYNTGILQFSVYEGY